MSLIRRFSSKLNRIIHQPNIGNKQLIIHIGQHKSMTSFFNNVFYNLCIDFDWNFVKYNNALEFEKGWNFEQPLKKTTILCLYNFYPDLEQFSKINYVGSHIIRDPRDLLVSGYNYHLWTTETWANEKIAEHILKRLDVNSLDIGLSEDKISDLSYKEILNKLDKKEGMLVEMNFRDKHFRQMEKWNYTNENFYELKYEEVFKNELKSFEKLFKFYGFSDFMIKHGLKVVQENTFDNLTKKGGTGGKKHASVGNAGQWREKIPQELITLFHQRYVDLLQKQGYSL